MLGFIRAHYPLAFGPDGAGRAGLLVGTLAALQYRWLGQVSDAERDAMRAMLQRRAVEFADDFDREITLAYTTFSAASSQATAADPAPVAAALSKWKETARFPDIVRAVYSRRTRRDRRH